MKAFVPETGERWAVTAAVDRRGVEQRRKGGGTVPFYLPVNQKPSPPGGTELVPRFLGSLLLREYFHESLGARHKSKLKIST
jgi:hypothetical protein